MMVQYFSLRSTVHARRASTTQRGLEVAIHVIGNVLLRASSVARWNCRCVQGRRGVSLIGIGHDCLVPCTCARSPPSVLTRTMLWQSSSQSTCVTTPDVSLLREMYIFIALCFHPLRVTFHPYPIIYTVVSLVPCWYLSSRSSKQSAGYGCRVWHQLQCKSDNCFSYFGIFSFVNNCQTSLESEQDFTKTTL